jgi:hypothetical protein
MELIRFYNFDISQVFNGNYKGAFNFSIYAVKALSKPL